MSMLANRRLIRCWVGKRICAVIALASFQSGHVLTQLHQKMLSTEIERIWPIFRNCFVIHGSGAIRPDVRKGTEGNQLATPAASN
jgi:hypothetical protein